MTKQGEVRDWNKDMELLQKPHKNIADVATILDGVAPYWHQESEKWRIEAFRKYPTPEAYDAACAALHKHIERADAAEAREKKLQDENKRLNAILKSIEDENDRILNGEGMEAYEEALASLYPKEEEAK